MLDELKAIIEKKNITKPTKDGNDNQIGVEMDDLYTLVDENTPYSDTQDNPGNSVNENRSSISYLVMEEIRDKNGLLKGIITIKVFAVHHTCVL
jgi:hypothetical protein